MLESLLSLCNQVELQEEKGTSFGQLIGEVIDFSAKLEYHSSREENYLFKMMEVYLGEGGGPISVMEYEHEQAKGFISEFKEILKQNI